MTGLDKAKKQLLIFLLIAYGVTYLTGILCWYGSTVPIELSIFPNAQMLYPAAGVMLAYLLTNWEDGRMPKAFYICFLFMAFTMLVLAVISVIFPEPSIVLYGQKVSIWALIPNYAIIGGSILCWIAFLISGKQKRAAYGLGCKNFKASILCIAIFLILYFGRASIAYALQGQAGTMFDIIKSLDTWTYLLFIPLNFILAFAPFLGEEYGWRYYLQPILQKRFGMRIGVLVLGIAWGLWHIFLDFFYYTAPENGLIMTVSQIITCMALGIFFAWAYLKTGNIWVPVILHFLNNNLTVVISNDYSQNVLENQQVTWEMIPSTLILNGILFGFFLLSKEFQKNT